MGDAILGGDTWQVHLGRSGGKLMSRAELEAAVASNEIGLETLVREPGSFTWTTAGAATGRSAAPALPPEPESSEPITLSGDDSDVQVGSFDEVTSVEVAPTTSDVPAEPRTDRGFTEDEEEVTRPVPIGRSLSILAGVAFLAGAIVVAAPWRASPADALAKANAKTAMPAAPPTSTGAPVIVTSVLPPPPEATPPAPEATPPAEEKRKGAIVVVVVPPKPTPVVHAPPQPKPAKAAPAKAALPPVHPPRKPAAVAVSCHAHAHAAPPPRTASATPKAAPAKAPRAPKPAAPARR